LLKFVDLIETVDDDVAHALLNRKAQLIATLVVSVEDTPIAWHSGVAHSEQLPTSCNIQHESFIMGQPRHGAAEKCLGRVNDSVCPESFDGFTGPVA
jgi:hypothetical protein